jgi:hypothetical protein
MPFRELQPHLLDGSTMAELQVRMLVLHGVEAKT